MKRINMIGVDWQKSFVSKNGSLSVPGAEEDAKRTATLIDRLDKKISAMFFSMDSHQYIQIFFPSYFLDKNNQHPAPFTPISHQELVDGVYRTVRKEWQTWAEEYTKELETKGRYSLFLWPFHTIVGTEGWSLDNNIAEALKNWEINNTRRVNYIVKGNNPFCENYSIFQAEVPHPSDSGTQLNRTIITAIEEADEIILTGQALSHCVAWSCKDLANNFSSPDYIKKIVLLTDTSSSVPGFEKQGEEFVEEMVKLGMKTSTTKDYLN